MPRLILKSPIVAYSQRLDATWRESDGSPWRAISAPMPQRKARKIAPMPIAPADFGGINLYVKPISTEPSSGKRRTSHPQVAALTL